MIRFGYFKYLVDWRWRPRIKRYGNNVIYLTWAKFYIWLEIL